VSELPTGWIQVSLKSLVLLNEKLNGIDDDTECGFVPMRLVPTSLLGDVKFETRMWGKCKKGYTHFMDGDVLLAKITPCFENGKSVLVSGLPNGIGAGSTEYFVLRSRHVNANYLHSFVKTKRFKEDCTVRMSGSVGHKRVPKDYLLEYQIPVAPLNEQIRIANKLDSLLAKVDAAQAHLERIPTLLKRFRQSVLAAATSGELTKEWREGNVDCSPRCIKEGSFQLSEETLKKYKIPETWQWVALGSYAKCNRGKFSVRPRNDPSCFDGEYPFIQIGDLQKDGGYIKFHNQTLNEKGLSVSRMFDTDTVVIAIVGATIANTGILGYPMCFPDSLVGINSPSILENIYVDYYFRANKENIRQASYAGGGQPNIKLTILNPLPLPVPPLEEQKEIVRRVESLFALADVVEKQYSDARQRVDRLTQSLLAKAFRGELVPQYPSDEPASALLKRIQAEREAQAAIKPARKTRSKKTTKAKKQTKPMKLSNAPE